MCITKQATLLKRNPLKPHSASLAHENKVIEYFILPSRAKIHHSWKWSFDKVGCLNEAERAFWVCVTLFIWEKSHLHLSEKDMKITLSSESLEHNKAPLRMKLKHFNIIPRTEGIILVAAFIFVSKSIFLSCVFFFFFLPLLELSTSLAIFAGF